MNELKIALIHATTLAVEPVSTAFRFGWPQAKYMNILDDGLTSDLLNAGFLNDSMVARMVDLAKYAQTAHVHGVLFTCSAFGDAIDEAKRRVDLPILKPNEAMFDEALEICASLGGSRRIGLLTTFKPASVTMHEELEVAIRERNLPIQIDSACDPQALEDLNSGDTLAHDQRVIELAQSLPQCDVLLLGQFSMARCHALVEAATHKTVLSSPGSAVRKLKSILAPN
jgi:Asp/Glu/Hydantoin racemase